MINIASPYNLLSEKDRTVIQKIGIEQQNYDVFIYLCMELALKGNKDGQFVISSLSGIADKKLADVTKKSLCYILAQMGYISVSDGKCKEMCYPTDEANRTKIWRTLTIDQAGKCEVFAPTEKNSRRKNNPAGVNFIICVNGQHNGLSVYDKYVCCAIASIYLNAGGGLVWMPYSEIFKIMGFVRNLKDDDKKKIDSSITKMMSTLVNYSNHKERTAGMDYPRMRVECKQFLVAEIVTKIYKGNETRGVLVKELPAMIEFAFEHNNEITEIPISYLAVRLNKSDNVLKIKDYLIWRIVYFKKIHNPKILYSAIWEGCGFNNADVSRNKKKYIGYVEKILKHFTDTRWISGYKKGTDGISIQDDGGM